MHFVLFQGEKPAWFSVVASKLLPVHIAALSSADAMYEKYAGQEFFKVREAGAVMGIWLQIARLSHLVTHPYMLLFWPSCCCHRLCSTCRLGTGWAVLVLAATFLHTFNVCTSGVIHRKAAGLGQQLAHVADTPSLLTSELWASLGWVVLDVIPVLLVANLKLLL